MRILHVVRGLVNSSGTTHIVGPLAEAQARQGSRVCVYYVEKSDGPAVLPDPGLVESREFPMSLPLRNPGVSLSFSNAIAAHIADFDVVHVHAIWNFPTWRAMREADRAGVPYMVAPQGSLDPWALRQNRWGKRLYGGLTEVPLLKRANWMQALSAKEADQFRRFGLEGPIVVVPNGVAEAACDGSAPRLADRLGLPAGAVIVLFLSRVHPKKGLDILIPAFADLAARRGDVYLVIAGHDAGSGYSDEVAESIRRHGVDSRCRLLGEVTGAEKFAILRGADAFVLPSHSEGLPVAALEAMAAGKPVLLTDECNLPEVEASGAGLVVRPERAALAGALFELLSDTGKMRAMGERGVALVRERFTWEHIARSLVSIYETASERTA